MDYEVEIDPEYEFARCPKCGGELGGFPEDSLTAGIRCLNCDCVMLVTTNPNPKLPEFDKTDYDLFILWSDEQRHRVIAAAANILFIGVRTARDRIDSGDPVARAINAVRVKKLARDFSESGFSIRTNPEFPWSLD